MSSNCLHTSTLTTIILNKYGNFDPCFFLFRLLFFVYCGLLYTYRYKFYGNRHFKPGFYFWVIIDELLHTVDEGHTHNRSDEGDGVGVRNPLEEITVRLEWKDYIIIHPPMKVIQTTDVMRVMVLV